MFERSQIEQLLSLNGVGTGATDDEIKSVLMSARWHKDDVEAAIMVLRENKVTHQTHVDSLHKVFRTDDRLRPETVSALLGIEMNVSSEDIDKIRKYKRSMTPTQIMSIAFISLALSVIFVMASMWYLEMGIFYQIKW
ncbi:MAG: hypothetical protein AUK16_00215 [Parcubacteria group bacterium CG2_30_44_11]|nr:MAG: hypothetical protein AUK16_00215 [Parcubacteria group bacterium CG2_30_44_11]